MNKNKIFNSIIICLLIILCIFVILIISKKKFKTQNNDPNNTAIIQSYNNSNENNTTVSEISGNFFTNISFINNEKIITTASIDIGGNNIYQLENFIDGIEITISDNTCFADFENKNVYSPTELKYGDTIFFSGKYIEKNNYKYLDGTNMNFYVIKKEKLENIVRTKLMNIKQIDSLTLIDKDADTQKIICEYMIPISLNNNNYNISYILKISYDENTDVLNNSFDEKYVLGKPISVLLKDYISNLDNLPIAEQIIYK